MVSQLASRHVKVVLGGQGGDEIFGGYARYLVAYFEQCIKAAIDGTYRNGNYVVTIESIVPNLGLLREYKPMMQEFWREGLFDELDARYFRLIDRSTDMVDEVNWRDLDKARVFDAFRTIFNNRDNVRKEAYFDKMTHFDFKCLLPALLHVEDRMSMAHGLESRVPLLDHPLVEFAATVPADVKFEGGNTKHLLKAAFRQRAARRGAAPARQDGLSGAAQGVVRQGAARLRAGSVRSQAARTRPYFNAQAVLANFDKAERFSRKTWGLISWSSGISSSMTGCANQGDVAVLRRKSRRLESYSMNDGSVRYESLRYGRRGPGRLARRRHAAGARRPGPGDRQFRHRPPRQPRGRIRALPSSRTSIADGALIDRLFAEFKPDVVVHTAASYKDPDDWATDALVNAVGTANIAKACKTHKVGAADLFPDRAVLRHQAAAVADSARPSDQSGQFQLRDLEDRRRALRAVFGRRLGDVPPRQRHRPAQRVRAAADLLSSACRKGKSASSPRRAATSAMPATSPTIVVRAADGTGHGTYHFSSGRDVAITELYDAVVRAMKLNDYPEPEIKPLGPDDAASILLDPSRTFSDFGRYRSHRSTRSRGAR